jgi:hypothetical protein
MGDLAMRPKWITLGTTVIGLDNIVAFRVVRPDLANAEAYTCVWWAHQREAYIAITGDHFEALATALGVPEPSMQQVIDQELKK